MKVLLAAAAAAALVGTTVPAIAQEKLTVWWVKGFYKSEDDALLAAIKAYEAKTGVKVDLSQYAIQDMIPKSVAALDSALPPDVAYADSYDVQVAGKWAFDGRLEDISDLIEPMKARFSPNTIETAYLYNDKAKKKAYYAYPMKQQTLHIQYWKDMLATAGFKPSDIPGTWKEYWAFWCEKAQPAYPRQRQPGLRHRQSDGRGIDRLLPVVPELGRRLRRQAGGRQRQAHGRRPQGQGRAGQRAARLYRHLRQGLLAAVVDDVEGPRQQRRLPQPHDPDDAQLHHLDRGQVAGRRQQRGADDRAAGGRPQGL
jgi:hypothetical protein